MNLTAHSYLLEAAARLRKLNAQIELCETDQDIRDAIGAIYTYTREARSAALMATTTLDGPLPKKKRRVEI